MTPALRERPALLTGATYRIHCPVTDGALYITINDLVVDEQRQPFEIFINSRSMEHFQWVVALTRVVSAVFRQGGDLTFLVDELRSVFDPKGGYFAHGQFVPSLVAAIGGVLERHLTQSSHRVRDTSLAQAARAMVQAKAPTPPVRAESVASPPVTPPMDVCPQCHEAALVKMDGCLTCLNCGDSKCG